jgi:hypothetical protein
MASPVMSASDSGLYTLDIMGQNDFWIDSVMTTKDNGISSVATLSSQPSLTYDADPLVNSVPQSLGSLTPESASSHSTLWPT